MAKFSTKVYFNDDIRRLTFEAAVPTFDQLVDAVRTAYRESLPEGAAILFRYTDEEGDLVTVSTSMELAEAFSGSQGAAGGKVVKLQLHLAEAAAVEESEEVLVAARAEDMDAKADEAHVAPADAIEAPCPSVRFVDDLDIADGHVARPGDKLSKRWRVTNSGDTRWPEGTTLVPEAFSDSVCSVIVPLAEPNETVEIAAELIVPHDAVGTVRFPFVLAVVADDGAHQPLAGDMHLWVEISVQNPEENQEPLALEEQVADEESDSDAEDNKSGDEDEEHVEGAESAEDEPSGIVPFVAKLLNLFGIHKSAAEAIVAADAVVHEAVTCNMCQMSPIVGPRYKCQICNDFDMCSGCERTGEHDPTHFLTKMRVPAGAALSVEALAEPKGFKRLIRGLKKSMKRRGRRLHCRFVSDLSVPDHSELPAGAEVVKVWRLHNCGSQDWPQGTSVAFVKGTDVTVQPMRVQLKPAAADEEIDLSLAIRAPLEPGKYYAAYRMCTSEGKLFGHKFWVDFVVVPNDAVAEEKAPVVEEPAVVEHVAEAAVVAPVVEMAEPVAVEAAPAVEENAPFASELAQLHDMGFSDQALNTFLITKYKGDMARIVAYLIHNA